MNIKPHQSPIPLNMILDYTLAVEVNMNHYDESFTSPIESKQHLRDAIKKGVASPLSIAQILTPLNHHMF